MLPLIFISSIPSQNQVTWLKVIFFSSFVKDLLNAFLDYLSLVVYLFLGLLQMDHLVYPSLGVIRLGLHLLQQFHDRNS